MPIQRPSYRDELLQLTRDVWLSDNEFRDLRQFATVESDLAFDDSVLAANRDVGSCQITIDEPERVQMEVAVEVASILVLRDLYFPGWEVRVRSDPPVWRAAKLLRTNRVMRGVRLGPGRHTVEFRYRPKSVFWGGIITGSAIAGVGLFLIRERLVQIRSGN